jgi:hypothetical protein
MDMNNATSDGLISLASQNTSGAPNTVLRISYKDFLAREQSGLQSSVQPRHLRPDATHTNDSSSAKPRQLQPRSCFLFLDRPHNHAVYTNQITRRNALGLATAPARSDASHVLRTYVLMTVGGWHVLFCVPSLPVIFSPLRLVSSLTGRLS